MDIEPTELHQRTPLYIGSKAEVETVAEFSPSEPVYANYRRRAIDVAPA
jgi:hypothetical protein